jgi:hypothetical protein
MVGWTDYVDVHINISSSDSWLRVDRLKSDCWNKLLSFAVYLNGGHSLRPGVGFVDPDSCPVEVEHHRIIFYVVRCESIKIIAVKEGE